MLCSAHGREFFHLFPELSNSGCLPGKAGGTPYGSRKVRSILAVLAVVLLTGTAAGSDPVSLTHGPILGRISDHGVGVWARTERPGSFSVRYGPSGGGIQTVTEPLDTRLLHDNADWIHITGLKPDTRYHYELVVGESRVATGRSGSFRTLPTAEDYRNAELNPRGLFNFSFEFGCGNNQNLGTSNGPGFPALNTMLDQLTDEIHFAILNGDWLYESHRDYRPSQWAAQVNVALDDLPGVVQVAPTIVGVWENYKHFLSQSENLARWHRQIPSFFVYDDHEMLNDIWGAGSPGLRDRRAVFRDIGTRVWYDYLGWSNPTRFTQPIHFGEARLAAGSDVLMDPQADFGRLDLSQTINLHVHWGTDTAGVDDNTLDGVGGDPNAGVYRIVAVLGKNRLRIDPPADKNGKAAYSIGRRSYYQMRIANSDFFVTDDTRGHREMHDTRYPDQPGRSMLGTIQREWLMEGIRRVSLRILQGNTREHDADSKTFENSTSKGLAITCQVRRPPHHLIGPLLAHACPRLGRQERQCQRPNRRREGSAASGNRLAEGRTPYQGRAHVSNCTAPTAALRSHGAPGDSRSSGRSRLVAQADCRCLSAHASNGYVLGTTDRRAGSKSAPAASPAGQSVPGLRALRRAAIEDPLSHHGQGLRSRRRSRVRVCT